MGVADDHRPSLDQLQPQGSSAHAFEGCVFQMHPLTVEQGVGKAGEDELPLIGPPLALDVRSAITPGQDPGQP